VRVLMRPIPPRDRSSEECGQNSDGAMRPTLARRMLRHLRYIALCETVKNLPHRPAHDTRGKVKVRYVPEKGCPGFPLSNLLDEMNQITRPDSCPIRSPFSAFPRFGRFRIAKSGLDRIFSSVFAKRA